jgi:hypothetical protein
VREDQRVELLQAAYEVATSPTVTAYRKGSARKGVPGFRLERLLRVLDDIGLNRGPAQEVAIRLDAHEKQKAELEAYIESERIRKEEGRPFH